MQVKNFANRGCMAEPPETNISRQPPKLSRILPNTNLSASLRLQLYHHVVPSKSYSCAKSRAQKKIFFFIPVKVKWLAWIDAALFIWSIIQYLLSGFPLLALIPVIAILNYFLFFTADFARLFGRVKHQTSKQTINFKKAQKKARETKGYIHKCAVCGVTDEMDSSMEFRYCSKCNGYYCYCMNHINNHVHIE